MQASCFLLRTVLPLLYVFSVAPMTLAGPDDTRPEEGRFPGSVTDIDGRSIDVEKLARERNLVVVTLKAPWCPVCQRQLVRIRARLPELEACGVTFLVLAPGGDEELAGIRTRTEFPFPFIADQGLRIARSLGLAMTDEQILPCMLQILPNGEIGWRQLGRSGVYFGDRELSEFFDCSRFASSTRCPVSSG